MWDFENDFGYWSSRAVRRALHEEHPMASFTTNPVRLEELLRDCERGSLKLPDFQRSWVWDDERIRSLIASISLAFPVGALMTLATGGEVEFKARRIQGASDDAESSEARYLLLDGQQRMTLE